MSAKLLVSLPILHWLRGIRQQLLLSIKKHEITYVVDQDVNRPDFGYNSFDGRINRSIILDIHWIDCNLHIRIFSQYLRPNSVQFFLELNSSVLIVNKHTHDGYIYIYNNHHTLLREKSPRLTPCLARVKAIASPMPIEAPVCILIHVRFYR